MAFVKGDSLSPRISLLRKFHLLRGGPGQVGKRGGIWCEEEEDRGCRPLGRGAEASVKYKCIQRAQHMGAGVESLSGTAGRYERGSPEADTRFSSLL